MTRVHFLTAFQHRQVSLEMFQLPFPPQHHSLFTSESLLSISQQRNDCSGTFQSADLGTGIFLTWPIQGFTIRGLNNFTHHTLSTDPSKQIPGKGLLVASQQVLALQSTVMEGREITAAQPDCLITPQRSAALGGLLPK